ncbi:IKI3 family protein [Aspergillus niger]|nr:IKI3 family protein [Aspergillus niger]
MHASAQVLIPEDTGLTDATCIKRLLESQDLWVSHAPELKLYISISVGASMALSASSFSSQIGEMLCSSKELTIGFLIKLWSDLGLVALFKSCNHFHYSDLTSFELIIGIRRDLKQSSKTKSARKTALFDHLDDVQTPVHIQTVNLSTVNAFMSFTSKTESAQLYILDTDSLTKPNLVGDYYYKNYILKHTQDTIFFGPQQSVYKESSEDTQVTSFVDELEELHESEQVSSLLTPQEGFFERASPAGQHEQLYDLFKVGLESLLFGRTSSTNHSDLQNKTLQPLSQIAPSVFSPNYHKDQPSQIGERVSRDLIYSSDGEEELLRFSEPDEDSSCAMLSTTTAAAPSSSCGSLPFSQDDCEDENDDIMSDRFSGNDMDHTLFSDDMAEFEEFGDDNDDDDMLCGSF